MAPTVVKLCVELTFILNNNHMHAYHFIMHLFIREFSTVINKILDVSTYL